METETTAKATINGETRPDRKKTVAIANPNS
jgi:hypothetical protein